MYVGIGGTVLAIDPATGNEIWRAKLKGSDFVNVVQVGASLCAATKGELYGLDPATGSVLWNNNLKGLGTGFLTIAGSGQVPPASAQRKQQQAAAAAAAAAG
jgi:outer membrane protein assembly factor BamB